MKIISIKTKAIILGDNLFDVIDQAIPNLPDNSVIAVTSKIVSVCEGNLVEIGTRDKQELMAEQAEYFLPPKYSTYGFTITMKHNVLIPSAGIDESNGNGYYVLWPQGFDGAFDGVSALIAFGAAVALFHFKGNVVHVIAACARVGLVRITLLW